MTAAFSLPILLVDKQAFGNAGAVKPHFPRVLCVQDFWIKNYCIKSGGNPMAYTELIEEVKELSEKNAAEVLDFIKFLKSKENSKESNIVFDELKGGLIYMADDFDKTPDCFKGYI